MPAVGEVPEGHKPLLDVILEELHARGFYPYSDEDDEPGFATFWTHDDWKEWWTDLSKPDDPKTARYHLLMDTVAQIIGEESGWKSITTQRVDDAGLTLPPQKDRMTT